MWSEGSPSSRCFEKPTVKVCGPRLLSTPSWLLQAPAKATGSREKQPTGSWARVLSLKKAATRHARPVTGHTVCRRGQERLPGEREDHLSQDEAQQSMTTPLPWASGAAAGGRALPGHTGAAPGPASAKNHRKGWRIRLSCEDTAEAKQNLCAFLPSFLPRITLVSWRNWILTPGTPAC